MHIGSIAGNARRHELSNAIISKTLDSINYSAATFGTAMKARYNHQLQVLQASNAAEPLGFTTARVGTDGRMSNADIYPLETGALLSFKSAFASDYDFQKNVADLAPPELATGRLVNVTG